MNKLRTAFSLLAKGDFELFRKSLRINFCRLRLRCARNQPFVYRLAGVPLVCVPGMSDSEEHYLAGELDYREFSLLRQWLQEGDAFVDVGANLGHYSFAVNSFTGGKGEILAVEASPELNANLRQSSALLGIHNLVSVQCAAGDADKDVVFYIAPPGKSTGEQSMVPDPARSSDYVPQRIRMRTLAEIVAEHPKVVRPAVVKMDIEGAEFMALSAAPRAWLDDDGPLWIVEVNPTALARNGSTCAQLVAQFPTAAFERWLSPQFALTGERLLPIRRLGEDEQFTDAWFYNLIAVPRGTAQQQRRERVASLLGNSPRYP